MLLEMTWVLALSIPISMLLAFALGANDVGNFFGTCVGARVLSLRKVYFLSSVSEILGSVLLGEKVSSTIWKGIIDYHDFYDQEKALMLDEKEFFSPVSGTHSIVGATVGFALVEHGARGVNWNIFVKIIISWLVSPIIAGTLSLVLLYFIKKFIFCNKNPANVVMQWLPVIYAITVMINVFSILMNGPDMNMKLWLRFLVTLSLGIIVCFIVWYFVLPRLSIEIMKLSEMGERTVDLKDISCTETSETKVINYIRNYIEMAGIKRQSDVAIIQKVGHTSFSQKKNAGVQVCLFLETVDSIRRSCSLKRSGNKRIWSFVRNKHFFKDTLQKHAISCRSEKFDNIRFTLEDNEPCRNEERDIASKLSNERQILCLNDIIFDDRQQLGEVSPSTLLLDYELQTTISELSNVDEALMRKRVKKLYNEHDKPEVAKIFSLLQIMSAIFGSFTHGCNDVSNAIAPLVAVWMMWVTETNYMNAKTPLWILFFGGICISLGIFLWGRGTIQTIGEDITAVTPSSGFVMELCSALAVLIASNLGIPVSSTHCKVGSVVCVGRMSGHRVVHWKLVRNIAIAWAVTFPVTGVISAAVMVILKKLVMS